VQSNTTRSRRRERKKPPWKIVLRVEVEDLKCSDVGKKMYMRRLLVCRGKGEETGKNNKDNKGSEEGRWDGKGNV